MRLAVLVELLETRVELDICRRPAFNGGVEQHIHLVKWRKYTLDFRTSLHSSNLWPFATTLSSISRNPSLSCRHEQNFNRGGEEDTTCLKVFFPARISRFPCLRFSRPNPSSSVISSSTSTLSVINRRQAVE